MFFNKHKALEFFYVINSLGVSLKGKFTLDNYIDFNQDSIVKYLFAFIPKSVMLKVWLVVSSGL